jgi:serine/threonine protein phosphatase PrpC
MNGEYFDTAEVSDIGRKRKNNEDACLRIDAHGVFCVADGMGGQMGGDIASETIITTLQEVFGKATSEDSNTLPKRIALFRAATNRASKWIKDFADEKVVGQMGSTIVAMIVDPRDPHRAVGMHAGDSRLYRYRNSKLEQITVDHSAVNAMAAKLGIPIEKVPAKYQNELLRAVGLAASVELEKTPVDVSSVDIFMICSDGLCKMVPDNGVAKIIKDTLNSGVQSIAQALVNAANEAGGKDNCTVVIVKARDLSSAPRLAEPDDDDKTPLPPADLLANMSPPTPVPAADTPRLDSDDIRGDTPQTPTSDVPDKKEESKPASTGKFPEAVTPTGPGETHTHFITRADVNRSKETKPTPAPAQPPPKRTIEDDKSEAPTPTKGFPVGLIIGIVALLAVGVGIWFAVKPKSHSAPPVATTPAVPPAVAAAPPPLPAPTTPPPPPGSSSQAQTQAAYNDAMNNAKAAWAKSDYSGVVSFTATALQLIPGDATATKLAADAQGQLKKQDSWRTAFINGRTAYGNGDYKNALAWANEALKDIPGERSASELRENAQEKVSEASATDDKYQAAWRAGEAALKSDDLSTANAKAQEMLAIRPNDPTAQDIIKQSGQMMDYESAEHAFNEGDYDYALQICQNYSTVNTFQQLAQKSQAEQASLNDAKGRLASGDYSFAGSLQGTALARKAAFEKLLKQADSEQQTLNKLQTLKSSGNWQAAASTLADPANAALINKPPFQTINQWAKSAADAVQNQKQLQQANATFEEMLVWFNIKRPNDPYIQTTEARKQIRYDGQLDEKQRQEYLTTIAQLQTVFASSGQLNQNNRAKLLKDLEETVAHHE